MTTLDSLRKEYGKLTPFERAVMRVEAAARQDDAVIGALQAPSLWDAYHTLGYSFNFAIIALLAVYESQRAEIRYWVCRSVIGSMEYQKSEGKEKSGPEYRKEVETWIDRAEEAERHSLAWLRALEALDEETGSACITTARLYAAGHIGAISGRVDEGVDYSVELDTLREHWNLLVQKHPDAPKAKEPATDTLQ